MGMQVLGLSNNLNFALGPTRLNMMKKQKTPQRQLMRLGLLLPVFAGLLFAFAQPEYILPETGNKPSAAKAATNFLKDGKQITITGTVKDENGDPLPGTSIVIKGTTQGTVTDIDGKFKLDVPADSEITLTASFVGFKTGLKELTVKEGYDYDVNLLLERSVIGISTDYHEGDVPPPPPPPVPDEIKSADSEPVFVVVEEMPEYPSGSYGLAKYIYEKKKEMKTQNFFEGKKLKGKATIGFTVLANGKVGNVQVLKSSQSELTDDAALLIVRGMKDWTPGKQRGKGVPVDYAVVIEF
jgi:TonB family protein